MNRKKFRASIHQNTTFIFILNAKITFSFIKVGVALANFAIGLRSLVTRKWSWEIVETISLLSIPDFGEARQVKYD